MEPHILRADIHEQREEWAAALATIERALEIDPRNVNLWVSQSRIHLTRRNYSEAQRSIERALAIAPDGDAVLLGKANIALARDGDVSLMKELADSPLLDAVFRQQYGWSAAIQERDYGRALAYLDAGNPNRFDVRPVESYYGYTYDLAGSPELAREKYAIARRRIEEALAARPNKGSLQLSLAEALAGLGERALAVEVAQRAIASMPPSLAKRDAVRVAVQWVYVPAGDFDAALAALDTYLASAAPFSVEGLLPGPRLDPLRNDPRFQALVERYGRDRLGEDSAPR